MNKRIAILGSIVVLPVLAGCSSTVDDNGNETPETVGTTSQALTNVNNCATGTTPNAVGSLLSQGDDATYTRTSSYIDTICPSLDPANARTTTYVEFDVSTSPYSIYRFEMFEGFRNATNPVHCSLLRGAMRVESRVGSTWSTVYPGDVRNGEWVWNYSEPNLGHCDLPTFYVTGQNFGGASRFRVRGWAEQFDGSHATVTIHGHRNNN